MSEIRVNNIKTENNETSLVLTTGNNTPFIQITSTNNTVVFGQSSNIIHQNYTSIESIWIPASAFWLPYSQSPGMYYVEYANNKIMDAVLSYGASGERYGGFLLKMPKSWNKGNLDVSLSISQRASTTGNSVWNVSVTAINSEDSFDFSQNAAGNCQILITTSTANTLYVSNNSNYISGNLMPININTSDAEGPLLYLKVSRCSDDVKDTMSSEGLFHGIQLKYATSRENDS